ncbi:MAG: HAD hydrolase family protein [Saprospiraceae bacterium]
MDYNKLEQIDTFIFDVDGVLTNSLMHITESGELLRQMNVRDGAAMKFALEKGYKICIITKGNSKGVKIRLETLGAHPVLDQVEDKKIAFSILVNDFGINPITSLYMGDDRADLVVFDLVKLSCAPHDGCTEVIKKAEFVSPKNGGEGCVRDIIERVLRVRGDW